jgi:predicted NBD/HSP70 family sugar kinase
MLALGTEQSPSLARPPTSNKELERLCYILIDEVQQRAEAGNKSAAEIMRTVFDRLARAEEMRNNK